jgi:FAD/FMN-containing dehydrogenase
VIDLSAIRSVGESDGIATVGAGARLGEIDDRLATDALAIPAQAACFPTSPTPD